MYDLVIVTHLPAFYKVNLYNEIGKNQNIFVVFIAGETAEKRSVDFSSINDVNFNYSLLSVGSFQKRNILKSFLKLTKLLCTIEYRKIIVGGWDLPEFWLTVLLSKYKKNCLSLESTVLESNTNGIRGLVKKYFLSRISTVYASGDLHVQLLRKLSYPATVKITRGVGIINKSPPCDGDKDYERNYIYIGRLVEVKNLYLLIKVFNELPDCTLTIVGEGELEPYLRRNANSNINFLSSIDNSKLKYTFKKYDFLILPSLSEPWGLVVEEALYYGVPVIVSKQCGSSELIENQVNGFVFDANSSQELKDVIKAISAVSYRKLLSNIDSNVIDYKDVLQVDAYESAK